MDQNTTPATADQNTIALLPPAERAVIVLDATKTEARLRELVAASADITAVIDKDGREQAHRTAMVLRNARVAIEKTGKAARDDANAFNKAVIAKEKELVSIVQPEEDRVMGLRDRYDAEQARIKAEAERKEAERKARIQGQITSIRNIPVALAGCSADDMAAEIAELESFKAGEEFAEFHADADAAALTALATLRDMHKRQVAAEAEAARIAAERAALEAEKAERERVAAETKRQLEAQQAALAEERRKAEAEMQAQREAFEAERRAFQEQQAAAARAEDERKAAGDALNNLLPNEHTSEPADQWTAEEQTAMAATGSAPLEFNKIPAPAAEVQQEVAAELTASDADDKDLVDGFTIMVAGLYETRSADAIRELLDSVLVALEGQKVAA